MSRINTNVQSMLAQRVLAKQNQSLNTSLERLSTGIKINTGKDNPAGLIASENLRGERAGTAQAIVNAERANSMIGTAEGSLNEVSALLVELQTLVTETASNGGLTSEEIAANQQQVDAILGSINRIANSAQFGGKKLLDGTLDYSTSSVSSSDLSKVQINSARLTDGVDKAVTVAVTTAAEQASLTYDGEDALAGDVTLQVSGNKGSETLLLATGATAAEVKDAINTITEATGVVATLDGTDVVISSEQWGNEAFVAVSVLSGTFETDETSAAGKDPVVTINGLAAETDGLKASVRSAMLDIDVQLTSSFAGAVGNTSFNITGGGANFMIGAEATAAGRASVGIGSVAAGSLGNTAVGYLSSLGSGQDNSLAGGKAVDAQAIVKEAVSQVSNLRGRLGAFQKYTLAPTINSLEIALENVSSAESAIRDTDFAAETAALTRSQILSNAAMNVLAMANSQPQSVLSLLRG